ncbi:inositol monophosphatase family protein [Suttonella ornithocola]|uniref:Nus factor SuhB n=1 Tax=Suttonella ornithocola TaxID=279832 RepID=A0A380MTH7_9GAMM|nr:inositol monophosphatase family protein [Suttonella ornithocola]SUO95021.1 Inositol-1-monophosphatase [Suttonella ornithocola]
MNSWFPAYLQALSWVKEAGEHIRGEMRKPLSVQTKSSRRDLVTQLDVATEKFLTARLREHYPTHCICGEESQSAGESEKLSDLSGAVWFIDPIDGTMNFVKQHRDFGIMLALYVDGQPQIGIVYDVMRDELYSALSGQGAYLNQQRLPLLPQVSLQDSLIIIEGGAIRAGDKLTLAALAQCLSARMVGASAIVTGMLAQASVGAFITRQQMPWDAAAPMAILTEIGAKFSQPDGSAVTLLKGEPYLMALPGIHEELLSLYHYLSEKAD